jgi:hypothetical protein
MISRKTTLTLAELYTELFNKRTSSTNRYNRRTYIIVDKEKLYDFLFGENYEAWFCNSVRKIYSSNSVRPLQDFIMKIHTGETLYEATEFCTEEQIISIGQSYLQNLAKDILNYWHTECQPPYKDSTEEQVRKLLRQLELDGYIYYDSRLLAPEDDVIDVEEERSLLKVLFSSLNLSNQDVAFHHLDLSEEHYISQRWDDSISNSRKFLECVLQEVAAKYSLHKKGSELPKTKYESPKDVRDFLVQVGLLETKEKEAIATVYGLLSHTGGHPYMAQNDQARLLRHLALTFSQFVLLRFQGAIK